MDKRTLGRFRISTVYSLEQLFKLMDSMNMIIHSGIKINPVGRTYEVYAESDEFELLDPEEDIPLYKLEIYENRCGDILGTAKRIWEDENKS